MHALVYSILCTLIPFLTDAKVYILSQIIIGSFCVRYELTTRSISRYCQPSLRTLFRFLSGTYQWTHYRITLFNKHIYPEIVSHIFIFVFDESVEGKSRNKSYGIDKFYSSIAKQPINGICFFSLSIVDTHDKTSYFLSTEQVVYTENDKQRNAEMQKKRKEGQIRASKGEALAKGRKPGIPNKPKEENNSASFCCGKSLLTTTIPKLKNECKGINVRHVVGDTAYGTLDYLNVAKEVSCFIISKFRSNASLRNIYSGQQKQKGAPRIFGDKIDTKNLQESWLKKTVSDDSAEHKTYQFQAYAASMGREKLNIVIVKSIRKKDKKVCINIWFTNDLELDFEVLLNYYSSRFQIEFDFRDAKQHFGLSDFKNYKKENLTNFVNLSFLMCLISKILLKHFRAELKIERLSILDLKIIFNTRYTAKCIFNMLQNDPNLIFNHELYSNILPKELINSA